MKSFSLHAYIAWFKREPLKNAAKLFLALSIFCFPFQIRTLLFSPDLFLSGNFNPFTAVFLSFNNLIVLLAGLLYGFWILKKRLFLKKNERDFFWWWGVSGVVVLLVSFWSFNSLVHWYTTLHWGIIFVWFILLVSDLLSWRVKFQCFICSMFFQSAIGFTQLVFQSSLGLGRLGEPLMNSHVSGIAKIDWQGLKFIRPYGTFPHTNVLAGSIVFALFASMYLYQKSLKSILLGTLFFGSALILTFSRSAWLGFLIALIFSLVLTKVRHKLVVFASLICIFCGILFTQFQGPLVQRILGNDGQSSQERELYMDISKEMILKHPLGVGLGNFTLMMQDFTQQKLAPWVVQPVHNVYMLAMNELGIQGLVLFLLMAGNFVFIVIRERKEHLESNSALTKEGLNFSITSLKIALLFTFLVIGLFDHYFFTSEQGQFLFIFLMAFLCYTEKKDALPRMKS
jgi:hypothetical protein